MCKIQADAMLLRIAELRAPRHWSLDKQITVVAFAELIQEGSSSCCLQDFNSLAAAVVGPVVAASTRS